MTSFSRFLLAGLICSLNSATTVLAFVPVQNSHHASSCKTTTTTTRLFETVEKTRTVSVPLTWDQMCRQVASAMKEAAAQGQTRQIVRVLLPRDSTYGDLGKNIEDSSSPSSGRATESGTEIALVPLDESWQGGIMQLYRSASPTATEIMQQITAETAGGVPPRITEDRSVDESGVDGVGLLTTDDSQITCWLQPMQENVNAIVQMADKIESSKSTNDDQDGDESNNNVIALMNPQWRLVDDALDTASQSDGFWGGVANFLGGKGGALKLLKDAGFQPVYTFEGYVCKGANVRLLQVLDSEWSVFCERDNGESYIPVGSSPTRPTYQEVDQMLTDSDIGYKYERDFGMSPKL